VAVRDRGTNRSLDDDERSWRRTRDASKRTTEITQVRRGTTVDALPREVDNGMVRQNIRQGLTLSLSPATGDVAKAVIPNNIDFPSV